MPLPLVGAHAVLEGMPEFSKNADLVNSKVGGIHDKMGVLGTISQKAGGLVSGAFKVMAGASVAAVAGIASVGGGILKLGYDAAALPGIESVFKNMTNSMSVDADALMGKMRAATYGAVKDFDLMKSANLAMVGAGKEFGKMFAESLPTLMTVSREAAKAQGVSVEYMYSSITTGIKRMSPMILDNLGFQLSLGAANEAYAAKVGKTVLELTKEEKQMALLNEVMRVGTNLIDETGGHVDSVQKDVTAWGTALANVKDRIGIELVPILQKFMNLIGKPSQGMQDAIVKLASNLVDKLLPAIDTVARSISLLLDGPVAMLIKGFTSIGFEGFATLGDTISNMFSGGKINFLDLRQTLTKALEPLLGKEMADKLGKAAIDAVAAMQKGLEPLRDVFKRIAEFSSESFESLKGVIQGITSSIGGSGGDFPWEDILPPKLADVAYMIAGAIDAVSGAVGPFISTMMDAVNWMMAGDFATALDTVAIAFGTIFGPDAYSGVNTFGTVVGDILSQLGTLITNIFNTVQAVAEAVWPYIQTIITTVWDGISSILSIFMTTTLPALASAFDGILTWVNANWPAIQAVIVAAFTFIAGAIATVYTTVIPFLVSTFQGLVDWVVVNWPMISEAIGNVLAFISNYIQEVLINIQAFWKEHGNNILKIITDVWELIKGVITIAINIIKDVIKLVCSIINGDWKKAWNTIKDIQKNIWDAIKLIVKTAIDLVANIIDVAMGLIKLAWGNQWDAIKILASNTWDSIKKLIGDAIASVGKTLDDAMSTIDKAWTSVWNGLAGAVKNVWNNIIGTVCGGINKAIDLINDLIDAANKVPGINIPKLGNVSCASIMLAEGGILNRPTFVAGEAGAEVVAPLGDLLRMIKTSLTSAISDIAYSGASAMQYSGPQPSNTYNYGGDTYIREYNMTAQSMVRPGALAMEFAAMELAHA